jgi:hypothetical protein
VPFVAGNLVFYANARQPVLGSSILGSFLFVSEMFEVWLVVGQEIFCLSGSQGPGLEMAGDLRSGAP